MPEESTTSFDLHFTRVSTLSGQLAEESFAGLTCRSEPKGGHIRCLVHCMSMCGPNLEGRPPGRVDDLHRFPRKGSKCRETRQTAKATA